jgi:D-amino-acid oxidase
LIQAVAIDSIDSMRRRITIIGAGVSGLTCAVVFAEYGYRTEIFAEETGQGTTSAAAAAIWFPYDAEPAETIIPWTLQTYRALVDLSGDPRTGVSMIELRQFSRVREVEIPDWAYSLGAHVISTTVEKSLNVSFRAFESGFALKVPLMDTSVYLDYLANRFEKAGGRLHGNVRFDEIEDIDPKFDLVINCAGIGARELMRDVDVEPHRGQVAIVPRINNLNCAIVCDDAPLMYAIPRTNDCVFGGTNELSDNLDIDPTTTLRIVAECSRALNIEQPRVLANRVGLRPFRKSGVRVERQRLRDGRTIIHNYGHGGSGFTLSWGCAEKVYALASG